MKKIVSLILSLVMLMSITSGLNLTAYAETYGDFEYSYIENDLESAILTHIRDFLMEMGKGFAFVARQQHIVTETEDYFIDLVFYNRILHCNDIIELKNDEFKHEDLGQLNAYVGYYKKNEMNEGDNPPVGILLCTDKGSQMVEYALSGMDNPLFVSTYMLHLPDKKKLEEFMLKEIEEMGM